MNCPQCEQTVAPDSFRIGPWADDVDSTTGEVLGCARPLVIRCHHCGLFTCEEDSRGFIRNLAHISNRKDVRRLEAKLARRDKFARRRAPSSPQSLNPSFPHSLAPEVPA